MFFILVDRAWAISPASQDCQFLQKITLRASLAATLSFALALALGPRLIAWLAARFREPIKSPSTEVAHLHQGKSATPTMGGIFLVGGLLASTVIFGDWTNPYVVVAMLLALALAVLGACDDWIKLTTSASGMTARNKFLVQVAIAAGAAAFVYLTNKQGDRSLDLTIPFIHHSIALGWWFVPWATLVIVASSNAVNLTDGLDGLAPGCLICATGALGVVVYASGHAEWASYLGIPHVAGSGEAAVIAAGMLGGLLGFLWFNCHPASVFMGDTGSLPLGGLLGLLAIIARQEFLLLVIGGVFVVEAASVIAQVTVFRWRGTRILRCAPLHHHFQLAGWSEGKIVVRFWIAAAMCAVIGLGTLKFGSSQAPLSPQLTLREQVTRLSGTSGSKTTRNRAN